VSSDGTSTPDGGAERFAAALDGAGAVDPEIAREVALTRQLSALGSALDPDPQARERARKRLLAALAAEKPPANGPPRAS
jgi:hypothetical protein